MHLIVVSWLGKRRRRFWKVFVALFIPLQFRKKKKYIYIFEKNLLIFRRLLVPVWMWMWACIQRPASCQFVKRATDDWSSSKRPLIILKSSKMNWRESSRIAISQNEALIERWERRWRNPSFVPWDRKSSKCLQFDPINSTCTSNATANSSISTAISQQVRYYTPARFPIGSIGASYCIQSHPYGLVLQASSSQVTVRSPCEIPQPILTWGNECLWRNSGTFL